MSALGKKSQQVQAAKRMAAIDPVELADLRANPRITEGDAIGSIEIRNFKTGSVTRWTVLRGNRVNNYQLRTPDGRTSKKPHGMAWITDHLRPLILRKI